MIRKSSAALSSWPVVDFRYVVNCKKCQTRKEIIQKRHHRCIDPCKMYVIVDSVERRRGLGIKVNFIIGKISSISRIPASSYNMISCKSELFLPDECSSSIRLSTRSFAALVGITPSTLVANVCVTSSTYSTES